MRIGIGSEAQEAALRKAGCAKVLTVEDLEWTQESDKYRDKITFDMLLRPEDTIVMVQPGYLNAKFFKKIAALGCQFEVPGHDPVRLTSEDARVAWRRQKPRDPNVPLEAEAGGRPPKYPVPTERQIGTILGLWHGPKKPAEIAADVSKMLGVDVPKTWVRDQVIKAKGNARRKPDEEGQSDG